MAIRIVGSTAAANYGVRSQESGINIRTFQVRYFPEVDIRHQDYLGKTVFRSVSAYFSRQLSCEGEITGGVGVMAFSLGSALTIANQVGHFQPAIGTFLLDEATVSLDRHGWESVSVRASSDPHL